MAVTSLMTLVCSDNEARGGKPPKKSIAFF